VVSGHALLTRHAIAGVPADAHDIADREVGDVLANRADGADDLMAGDHRVGGEAPVVVDHADVAVANAAVQDVDVDLGRTECADRIRWVRVVPQVPGLRRRELLSSLKKPLDVAGHPSCS